MLIQTVVVSKTLWSPRSLESDRAHKELRLDLDHCVETKWNHVEIGLNLSWIRTHKGVHIRRAEMA